MNTPYPNAPRLPLIDDYHGTAVPDPYRWLEDAAAHPAAEAEQWRQWRTEWDAAQRAIFDEESHRWTMRPEFAVRLAGLLSGGFTGLPIWRGDRCFFSRRNPEQQLPVLLTVDPDGTERVLIDPLERDPTGRTTLDGYQPSWEGGRMAYLMSEGGTEESVLRVMDVATGEDIDGPIDRTRFSSVGWLPGGDAFYYVRRQHPDTLPEGEEPFHRRVRFHRIGRDAEQDEEIFGAGLNVTNYYSASVSRDGRWLVVSAAEGTAPRNDVYLADLAASSPEQPALVAVVERRDAYTSISVRPDGRMFVWTDYETPRGRILLGDPHQPQPDNWQPLVAEDPQAVLESFCLADGPEGSDQYLVAQTTLHTVGSLTVRDSRSGEVVRHLTMPGMGTISGPVSRPEGGTDIWYAYTDHSTPPVVYQCDTNDGATQVWARPPGRAEVPDVVTRQIVYTSGDGTEVRMYIISPDGQPNRPRPTILYGYGGFGLPLAPAYSPTALAWVSEGGVYAIANVRGGGEEGEEWHRAGMLGDKQNVFDDFHAAAQWLIDNGWTTPGQLCISGGSNGGLLVGAAVTQRPDLYGGAICTAPLLDMIRYVTSQLGATWTTEYGDPADPDQFPWLWSYSPYHHVAADIDYPALLMVVFDNDTRTDPMHGRKMVAELQHRTTGTGRVVLRTEADVGHGARSLDRSVAESADMLAFAAHVTDLSG